MRVCVCPPHSKGLGQEGGKGFNDKPLPAKPSFGVDAMYSCSLSEMCMD